MSTHTNDFMTRDLAGNEGGHVVAGALNQHVVALEVLPSNEGDDCAMTVARTADGRYLQSFDFTAGGIAASAVHDSRAAPLPLAFRLMYPLSIIGLPGVGATCRHDVASLEARLAAENVDIHHAAATAILRPLALLSYWHAAPVAYRIQHEYPSCVFDAAALRATLMPSWNRINRGGKSIWASEASVMQFARDYLPELEPA